MKLNMWNAGTRDQKGQGAVELFLVIALVTLTLLVGFTFYRERLAPQPTSAVVEKVPVEPTEVQAEPEAPESEEALDESATEGEAAAEQEEEP